MKKTIAGVIAAMLAFTACAGWGTSVSAEETGASAEEMIVGEAAEETETEAVDAVEKIVTEAAVKERLEDPSIGYGGLVLQIRANEETGEAALEYSEAELDEENPTTLYLYRINGEQFDTVMTVTEAEPDLEANPGATCGQITYEIGETESSMELLLYNLPAGNYVALTQKLSWVKNYLYSAGESYILYEGGNKYHCLTAEVDADETNLSDFATLACSYTKYLKEAENAYFYVKTTNYHVIPATTMQQLAAAGFTFVGLSVEKKNGVNMPYTFSSSLIGDTTQDYSPVITSKENTSINQMLKDINYTDASYQFVISGNLLKNTGFEGQTEYTESDLDYIYYLNTATGHLERVEGWISANSTIYGLKAGAYVATQSELPDSVTTGNYTFVNLTDQPYTAAEVTEAITEKIADMTVDETGLSVVLPQNVSVEAAALAAAQTKNIALKLTTYENDVTWEFKSITNPVLFNPNVTISPVAGGSLSTGNVSVNASAEGDEVSSGIVEISAESIDPPSSEADIAASAANQIAATANLTKVIFAYHGTLPGQAEVTLDLAGTGYTEGATLYLYAYNADTKEYTLAGSSTFLNNAAIFTMTEGSDCVISDVELNKDGTPKDSSGNTGDGSGNSGFENPKTGDVPWWPIAAVLAVGIATVVGGSRKNKNL